MTEEPWMQEFLDALDAANVRALLWFCPIAWHGERDTVTVEWRDGVGHCTAVGCSHTSAERAA